MYQNSLDKVRRDHKDREEGEKENHRKEMEIKNTQIEQLKAEIRQIEKENQEILVQIHQDTDFEIKDIEHKNTTNKL